MAKRLNLKNRLTLLFLVIGIVPLLIVGFVANMIAQDALESEYRATMSSIVTTKRDVIERYFANVEAEVALLAHDPRMVRASSDLGDAYRRLATEARPKDYELPDLRRNLGKYYSAIFAADYKAKNGGTAQGLGSYVSALSDEAVLLQSEYIVRNSSPAGSKQLLDRGQDRSSYSAIHGEYHPYLRDFSSKFEYDDILLIDLNSGEVVYTVNKDVDIGSNVLRGPNSKSSLAQAFRDLQKGDGSEAIVIGDFANYFSSYDMPEAFVGTTIGHNGRPAYALFFQLAIEKINGLMAQTAGLGRSGESYLVGADYLMRSDARLDLKNHSVIKSFMNPEAGRVETRPTREAIAGRKGVGYFRGYANYDVLAAYSPVPILNVKWGLVAEISKEESKASQKKLAYIVFSLILLTAVLVTLVGAIVGRGIAVPILRIGKDLGDNSDEVGRAATDLLASSEQLSAMAEEQAESINETAASTDEIAAMVGNNVNQAAASAELSTEIKLTTDKVDASMEKLDNAMKEIRDSNVQIQELVTVISEIAEKTAVIDEIVFQTKLLSFNASVEAERAGEHGRGFAVVAQEVGNLAKMSGKASVEITSMVKDSVKKAEKISRTNSEKVALVGQSVGETEVLLNKIGSDAERLLQQAQQILTSSKEQSEGIKQINEAMIQLEQATRQNSAAAHSTAAASDELKAQSSHLTANVAALLSIVSEDSSRLKTVAEHKVADRVPPPPAVDNVRPLRGQKKKATAERPTRAYEPKLAVGSSHRESTEPSDQADSEWEKL